MRRIVFSATLAVGLGLVACGPAMHVKPIGSRVDPLPAATPTPAAGAERALISSLPGGWRLSGGPADYTAATAAAQLGDEAGRFRGLRSYAIAEYLNLGQRVISAEAFVFGSPEGAGSAIKVGRPADAKAIAGDDLDDAFSSGLRAEGRKGALLVRVRWFEEKDEPLSEGAIDAMRDLIAAGGAAGLTGIPAASSPATSPTPDAAPTGTPFSSPSH